MTSEPRKGSRKLRKIIEEKRLCSEIRGVDGPSRRFLQLMGLNENYEHQRSLIECWASPMMPSYLGDFAYMFLTNRLPLNSRLSHFTGIGRECTFCTLDYGTIRNQDLSNHHGPVLLPKESQLHLFFQCPVLRRVLSDHDWTPTECLQPDIRNAIRAKINFKNKFEILHRIWMCKLSGKKPTRSRLKFLVW